MNAFPGGRIAVVGNGGCALRCGCGREIDRHETIIRFNNFQLDPEFSADYGERVTDWCTGFAGGGQTPVELRDVSGFRRIYCPFPIFEEGFSQGQPDLDHALACGERLTVVPPETFLELRALIPFPTTGMALLWWLWRERGSLAEVDLYGFSLVTPYPMAFTPHSFHYWKSDAAQARRDAANHDGRAEAALLRRLIGGAR